SGPMIKRWLSHTRVIAASSASRSGRYWASRSSSGTFPDTSDILTGMRLNPHNGDGHLRADQRAAYLVLNAVDNLFPHRHHDAGLKVAHFQCAGASSRLGELPGTPSPSRAMCDLFWMHLPWPAMERELGPLRILDLGCGSGEYA